LVLGAVLIHSSFSLFSIKIIQIIKSGRREPRG